ncbi:MAG: divalent-cation tolerance protein CutA [Gemmatimonadaceae bacterium]|nr:divalent-cation tolerance protein CutA [Gloeobacterales cyanobacterium ES-bin-141]
MSPLLVVLSTVPDAETGLAIARNLVEERLVACAQLLPAMTSVYIWQETVQQETEHLLILKVPSAGYTQLEAALRQLHPYEVPEIIAIEASRVVDSYLVWATGAASSTTPNA